MKTHRVKGVLVLGDSGIGGMGEWGIGKVGIKNWEGLGHEKDL